MAFDPARSAVSVYEDGDLTASVPPSPLASEFEFGYPEPFTIEYNAYTHELDISDDNSADINDQLNVPIDLESVLGGPGPAIVGFTAASTSAASTPTELDSWQLARPAG